MTTYLSADIDFSTSGDHTIASPSAGKFVAVHRIVLTIGGVTVLTMKSDTNVLDGTLTIGGLGGIVLDWGPKPWWYGNADEDFIINSSNAVSVTGKIEYRER